MPGPDVLYLVSPPNRELHVTHTPAEFIIESLGHTTQAEGLVEPGAAVEPDAQVLQTPLDVAPMALLYVF